MKNYYNFNINKESDYSLHSKERYEDMSVFFEYLMLEKGFRMTANDLPKNYIIAYLSGEHEVFNSFTGKQIVKEDDLICLSKHTKMSGTTLISGEAIMISFDSLLHSCNQNLISQYLSYPPSIKDIKMTSIKMCYPLKQFFEMMAYLIKKNRTCFNLYKIKLDEFFILLKGFYKKEEIIYFLGPIILGMTEFSIYVYSNYYKANNLHELIKESYYSRATFYRKFKDNFGSITPQKWFNIQKRSQFLDIGSIPDITPKLMMQKLNLNSMSTLYRLCKELFGCTPIFLIKTLKEKQ